MFRLAGVHPPWRHALHTALQIVLFWSTFLWLLPTAVLAGERALGWPPMQLGGGSWLGPLAFAGCSALGLWSAAVMALRGQGTPLPLPTARRFVTAGPYRALRNPMALAGIGQGAAVGIWRDSVAVVLYALAGAIAWHTIARPPEERDLAARFGDEFEHYRQAVPIWWPWRASAAVDRTVAAALPGLVLALHFADLVTTPAIAALGALALLAGYWLWVRPHTDAANATSSGHSAAKSAAKPS